MQCEGGMVYEPCGTVCPEKCLTLGEEVDYGCELNCVEGCHCPNGTVLHNGECIVREYCPCIVKGKEIPHGTVIRKNCKIW